MFNVVMYVMRTITWCITCISLVRLIKNHAYLLPNESLYNLIRPLDCSSKFSNRAYTLCIASTIAGLMY